MRGYLNVIVISILCSMLVSVTGCGSSYMPPQTYNYNKERVYSKPYSQVLQKVTEWFDFKKASVKKNDQPSVSLSAEYKLKAEDLNPDSVHRPCDCGKPGDSMNEIQKIKNAAGNFNVVIERVDDNNTKVIVNVAYKADLYTSEYGSSTMGFSFLRALDCNSTGLFEKELLDFVGQ
jgi:hypothetical protein